MQRLLASRSSLLACAFVWTVGIVGGRQLACVLHEVVGHLGVAIALGGEARGVTLFPFAGGEARVRLSDADAMESALVSAGGIVVNVVTGAVALAVARVGRLALVWATLSGAFGAASVVCACVYAVAGLHEGVGDPIAVVRAFDAHVTKAERQAWAAAALLVSLPMAFVALRVLATLQERWRPGTSPGERLRHAAGGLGVAVVVAVVLPHTAGSPDLFADARENAAKLAVLRSVRDGAAMSDAVLARSLDERLIDERARIAREEGPPPPLRAVSFAVVAALGLVAFAMPTTAQRSGRHHRSKRAASASDA